MPDVSLNGIEFEIKGSSDKASDSIKKLIKNLGDLKGSLKDASGVKGLTNSLKKLESISTESLSVTYGLLKEISSLDFSNIQEAAAGIKEISNAAKAIAKIDAGESKQIPSIMERIGAAASGLKSHVVGAASAIAGFGSAVARIASPFVKLFSAPIKKATKNVTGLLGSIKGVIGGFKRIAGYRILRTIIKEITQGFAEGTKNLYEWSRLMGGAASASGQTFAQAMDSIATSMLYFKNSVGAAAGPLISALAPAIDFVVDKIVTLLNLINQLLAKLSGATSWNRAKKKATQYGDAVEGAGQAAKDAIHYLAPFDELNVLPDQKDKGGSGGAAEDYSDMFEEVTEFSQGIADFADAIKQKVADGDWQGLGELLGGKINDVVESINFGYYGSKVGGFINAWFTTKYWTLETINFENIGTRIGQFLNNMLSRIDFETIGRTFTQKFTMLGDLIIGAVETINWNQVGDSIGDLIRGAFNQLSEWIQGVDWSSFGSTVYNALKDTVEGLDFGSIAQSMFTLLGSAIRGAAQFSYSFVKEAVDDIWGYLISFGQDENGGGVVAGKEMWKAVLKGIANGLLDIGKWIKENIVDPFMNALVGEDKWTDMKQSGLDIMKNMITGIQNGWTLISAWFSDVFVGGMKQFGINAVNGLLEHVQTAVNGAIETINGMIDKLPEIVKEKLGISHIDPIEIPMLPDLDPPVGTFYAETKQRIEEESKKKPTDITAKVGVTSIDTSKISKPTIDSTAKFTAKQTAFTGTWSVNGNPMFGAVAKFTSKQQAFTGAWSQNGAPMFGSIAKFNQKQTAFTGTWSKNGNPIFGSIAKFTAKQQAFTGNWSVNGAPMFGSIAKFNSMQNSLSSNQRTFSSTANFNSYSKNFNSATVNNDKTTPKIDAEAHFVDTRIDYTPTIDVNANIRSHNQDVEYYYKNGGIVGANGPIPITRFASGGGYRNNSGQMFIAREAGPELVGTLGGHTAVMNNDQIVSSVAAGVAKSIASIKFHLTGLSSAPPQSPDSGMDEESIYRAMLRALNDSDVFPDEIDLDGDVVYRKMVNRNRQERMRLGVNPMMTA